MQPKRSVPERKASTSTSRSLLQHLHDNDQEAWDKFVLLYTPLVWHWCRRMNLPVQDSADVFQEIFQSVSVHFANFHRDRPGDTFRGWLRTITKNKVLDHFRKQLNEPQGVGGTEAKAWLSGVPEVTNDLDEQFDENETDHPLFRKALELIQGSFEETTWRAFLGVVVDGRSPQDVAEKLHISSGAVRVAKCRVLQRLRQELGDLRQ